MLFFFFNDTATTEIYTLSLHDALPISGTSGGEGSLVPREQLDFEGRRFLGTTLRAAQIEALRGAPAERPIRVFVGLRSDRKSTRLNSSHANISYAVFCLKKKKNIITGL